MAIANYVMDGLGPSNTIPFFVIDGLGNFSMTGLVASPSSLVAASIGNTVTLTGVGTSWTPGTPGSPTFTLSSTGSGAAITAQVVNSTTGATLTIDAGTVGTITITDPDTGNTANISVAAASVGAAPRFFGITLDTMRSPSGNPITHPISLG